MRDSLGKEIDVGDRVVYSHSRYADLRHGRVVAITSRMIRIQALDHAGSVLKTSSQVAIVEKFDA